MVGLCKSPGVGPRAVGLGRSSDEIAGFHSKQVLSREPPALI